MPLGLHFMCLGWPWTSSWMPWGHPGNGMAPELAWRPQHGLDCIQARARALFHSGPEAVLSPSVTYWRGVAQTAIAIGIGCALAVCFGAARVLLVGSAWLAAQLGLPVWSMAKHGL